MDAVTEWIGEQQTDFNQRLLKDGVLLFRGFPVQSAQDFYRILALFAAKDESLLNYVGGASPREEVEEKVYTSTEAPPFVTILQHPEMCYLSDYPTKLGFYCHIPSETGGQTPLTDARQLYREMPNDLVDEITKKQVVYRRILQRRGRRQRLLSKLHRAFGVATWNYVYKTDDKALVAQQCADMNQKIVWNSDESLTTESKVPAVLTHPVTGDKVWFNTLHNFIHERNMFGNIAGPVVRFLRRITGEKFEIYFGDGTEIPVQTKQRVKEIIDARTWSFDWQKGDVLIIDNLLYWHGRSPFKGDRKILAGLIGKVEQNQ